MKYDKILSLSSVLMLGLIVISCKPHKNMDFYSQSDQTEKSLADSLDALSENYEQVLAYPSFNSFNEADWREYNEFFSQLKKKFPEPFPKHSLSGCPQAWIPLCSFRGKYYIQELMSKTSFWFNDSLFVYRYIDGTFPCKIDLFEKLSKRHFRTLIQSVTECDTIDLYLVDLERKVAVVRQYNNYSLHVACETAHLFDMIAPKYQKKLDGEVIKEDPIDYKKLIAKCK